MAYLDTVRTAQEVVSEAQVVEGQQTSAELDEAARAAAETAGVTQSQYVDYEAKMNNYATRSDVEPLAERRARDIGLVADQSFRRKGEGSIAVFTSPADQNVAGWDGTPSDADGAVTP
jgi:hypothetical protein